MRAAPAQDHDHDIRVQRRRVILSGLVGTTLEWFDFLLYGLIGPAIFDKLFFSNLDASAARTAVLLGFAAAYAARPLGAVIFGHFGDRIGRKPMMYISLTLMGVSTALIGAIPTYATIGIAAPILLLVLRSLQGLALGGETGGVTVLAAEFGPNGRRGFFTALVQVGGALGSVAASLAAAAIALLPTAALLSWGWRVPFLLSAVLVLLGFYIRRKVAESPILLAAMAAHAPERIPLVALLRRAGGPTLTVFLCNITQSGMVNLFSVFGLVYGVGHLGVSRSDMLTGILLGNVVGVVANPLYGRLSDRIGRRSIIIAAMVVAVLYAAFVFFPVLALGDPWMVVLVTAIPPALIQPMIFGTGASFFTELIPDARLRFTGVGLGSSGGSLVGGFLPAIADQLLSATGSIWGPVTYYATLSAVSIGAVLLARETRQLDLAAQNEA